MTTTDDRQLAVCRTYEELRDAIAAYCAQYTITRQELDHRAGLADGHSAKLLAPATVKRFGSTSLRWIWKRSNSKLWCSAAPTLNCSITAKAMRP